MRKPQIIVGILLIGTLLILGGCTSEQVSAPASAEIPETSLTASRLLTPHNGATDIQLSPTLLWQPVTNAGGYELWISLNYDFSDTVHNASCRLTAYQFSEELNPSTQYYWIVAAKMNPADPDTPVAWSEVWTFTTAPAPVPPEPREFSRTFNVPMTDVHIEYFDFGEGDRIAGKFTVAGQYTVNLWVIYEETLPEGGKVLSPSNCVLETKEALEKNFSFITPVSSRYAFFFGGFYADKADSGMPYRGLSQIVRLDITVYPYQ